MGTCLALIPIYKSELSSDEDFSVRNSLANLAGQEVRWLAPTGLDIKPYSDKYGVSKALVLDKAFFASIETYSQLLLSDELYAFLADYEFLLICQTDAIVLRNDLNRWLMTDYDYIGAPWPSGWEFKTWAFKPADFPEGISLRAFVGNGGLSLRRISAIRDLFKEFPEFRDNWAIKGFPEDLFISFAGSLSTRFRLPNLRVASEFAQELEPDWLARLNGGITPFGVHAWHLQHRTYWESQAFWPKANQS
jgi:hypothetical protein